ncbi:MAG: adenine phosphoribosyltransferase [Patescibacteria group bacterium]|nr:adenine phosphoribosyltransferase [Patescibacteria group bacterium]
MDLRNYIREVPDWPKSGVNFYDVTTLMENPDAFRFAVDTLAGLFKEQQIDKIVGIDARGFLFAAPVAYQLGVGLSIVRKKGKLPYKTLSKDYTLEYASNTIEMHEDTIKPGEKVVLIDDLIATGGTAVAATELIEQMGGDIVGIGFLVDLPFLGGSEKLKKYKTYSLIQYHSE